MNASARSVGIGGASVADPTWTPLSNPASLVRLTQRAVSLDYGQDAISRRYLLYGALPSRVIGTFGVGAYVYSTEPQAETDDAQNVIGTLYFRDIALAASYAVTFGKRFGAGLTYKLIQDRVDCSGTCRHPAANTHASTGGVDVGAHVDVGPRSAVHVAAAVRNVGPRLQVNDRAQADKLPTEMVGGVSWDVPNLERYVPDASLRLLVDASRGVGVRLEQRYHVGAEAIYDGKVALRAGYAKESGGYGGPALGFGFMSKRFALDVARQLASEGLLTEEPPTYVGLRYAF